MENIIWYFMKNFYETMITFPINIIVISISIGLTYILYKIPLTRRILFKKRHLTRRFIKFVFGDKKNE